MNKDNVHEKVVHPIGTIHTTLREVATVNCVSLATMEDRSCNQCIII